MFQIIAGNRGHICGTLIYKEKPTDFGGTINVTPPSLNLKPDELKSFNLSFSSNYKGEFVERVDFVVKETLEVLSLHIKYVARDRWRNDLPVDTTRDTPSHDASPLYVLQGLHHMPDSALRQGEPRFRDDGPRYVTLSLN